MKLLVWKSALYIPATFDVPNKLAQQMFKKLFKKSSAMAL